MKLLINTTLSQFHFITHVTIYAMYVLMNLYIHIHIHFIARCLVLGSIFYFFLHVTRCVSFGCEVKHTI